MDIDDAKKIARLTMLVAKFTKKVDEIFDISSQKSEDIFKHVLDYVQTRLNEEDRYED